MPSSNLLFIHAPSPVSMYLVLLLCHQSLAAHHNTAVDHPLGSLMDSASSGQRGDHGQPKSVCQTPVCVREAARLIKSIDNRTQPCDDFYQFACGRWIQEQPDPIAHYEIMTSSQNVINMEDRLLHLIESRTTIEQESVNHGPQFLYQLQNMYMSCINLSQIEALGDEPLLEVIRDLGGWPVVSDSSLACNKRKFTTTSTGSFNDTNQYGESEFGKQIANQELAWWNILIKSRQLGISHGMIIDFSVQRSHYNRNQYMIYLDHGSLGMLDRSFYLKDLNDTIMRAYYELMVNSAIMLGARRRDAESQMLEVLKFEASLARIYNATDRLEYIEIEFGKLHQLASNINWKSYLKSLLRDEQLDLDKERLVVRSTSYLSSLDQLLVASDKKTIANYIIWRIVLDSMNSLNRKWRDSKRNFEMVLNGRQEQRPRRKFCLRSIQVSPLGMALSALYVRNYPNSRLKTIAMEMFDHIIEEFFIMLDENDWLDRYTRQEAKAKARAIKANIGYPQQLLQDEFIEKHYNSLKLLRNKYFQNVRRLKLWVTDEELKKRSYPNRRDDWRKFADAATLSASHQFLDNTIRIPAGALQESICADRPQYMNFGTLGYLIGHEITHGYDNYGRQYDSQGNYRNWWTSQADSSFRKRAQCLIEQYSNYSLGPGLQLDGARTMDENIADNVAFKIAFRAYRSWTRDRGHKQSLPGLDYTPDQLFWISAASLHCSKLSIERQKRRITSDLHSPPKFNIIGPLSNSAEFAASFNCPLGSLMNPKKKCLVW